MARLNSGTTVRRSKSVMQTSGTTRTHEGGAAYKFTSKTDLFMTAVTHFYGEDTFYESSDARSKRFIQLVHHVTAEDPAWVRRFIHWLRHDANMRTASLVAAVEYAQAGGEFPRRVINDVCVRADEPGEILSYIKQNGYKFSGGVQRGVADAAVRLYNERNVLKWDSNQKPFRFGDVVELSRPAPKAAWQSELFKFTIDDRHGRGVIPESAKMMLANKFIKHQLSTVPDMKLRLLENPQALADAGMTWEQLSSYGPMDADSWSAIIPSMGYMALIRNLRNFDEAKVPLSVQKLVANRISDYNEVRTSRQLPFRFLSAYNATQNIRYKAALAEALDQSVLNIPIFAGRTLVLIDTSASMSGSFYSQRSTVSPAFNAGLFGIALAKAQKNCDVFIFADRVAPYALNSGMHTLTQTEDFCKTQIGRVGHGTDIDGALRAWNKNYDRVFIFTDMQTQTSVRRTTVPASVPVYGFNLGGYGNTALDLSVKNRYELGGLTDATFKLVPMLEAGLTGKWPWDN